MAEDDTDFSFGGRDFDIVGSENDKSSGSSGGEEEDDDDGSGGSSQQQKQQQPQEGTKKDELQETDPIDTRSEQATVGDLEKKESENILSGEKKEKSVSEGGDPEPLTESQKQQIKQSSQLSEKQKKAALENSGRTQEKLEELNESKGEIFEGTLGEGGPTVTIEKTSAGLAFGNLPEDVSTGEAVQKALQEKAREEEIGSRKSQKLFQQASQIEQLQQKSDTDIVARPTESGALKFTGTDKPEKTGSSSNNQAQGGTILSGLQGQAVSPLESQRQEKRIRQKLDKNPELLRLSRNLRQNTGEEDTALPIQNAKEAVKRSDLTLEQVKDFNKLLEKSGIKEGELSTIAAEERSENLQEFLKPKVESGLDFLANPPKGENQGLTSLTEDTGKKTVKIPKGEKGLSNIFEETEDKLTGERQRELVATGVSGAVSETIFAPQRRGGQIESLATGELTTSAAAAATTKELSELKESAEENPQKTGLILTGSGIVGATAGTAGPTVLKPDIPDTNLAKKLPTDGIPAEKAKDFAKGDLGTKVEETVLVKRGGRTLSDIKNNLVEEGAEVDVKNLDDGGKVVTAEIEGPGGTTNIQILGKDVTRREVAASKIKAANQDFTTKLEEISEKLPGKSRKGGTGGQKVIQRKKTEAEKTDASGEDLQDLAEEIIKERQKKPDTTDTADADLESDILSKSEAEAKDTVKVPGASALEDQPVTEDNVLGTEGGQKTGTEEVVTEEIQVVQDTGQDLSKVFQEDTGQRINQDEELVLSREKEEQVRQRKPVDIIPDDSRKETEVIGDQKESDDEEGLLLAGKETEFRSSVGAEILGITAPEKPSRAKVQNPTNLRPVIEENEEREADNIF